MGQREGGHALSQGRAFPANNCGIHVPTFPRLIDRIRSRGNFGSTNQVGKPSLAGRFTGGGLNTRQSVVSSLFADD